MLCDCSCHITNPDGSVLVIQLAEDFASSCALCLVRRTCGVERVARLERLMLGLWGTTHNQDWFVRDLEWLRRHMEGEVSCG